MTRSLADLWRPPDSMSIGGMAGVGPLIEGNQQNILTPSEVRGPVGLASYRLYEPQKMVRNVGAVTGGSTHLLVDTGGWTPTPGNLLIVMFSIQASTASASGIRGLGVPDDEWVLIRRAGISGTGNVTAALYMGRVGSTPSQLGSDAFCGTSSAQDSGGCCIISEWVGLKGNVVGTTGAVAQLAGTLTPTVRAPSPGIVIHGSGNNSTSAVTPPTNLTTLQAGAGTAQYATLSVLPTAYQPNTTVSASHSPSGRAVALMAVIE